MTVAAGFVCKDGVILCADTEVTTGNTGKYQQSKVVHLHGVSYAVYAGDVAFVAEIAPQLRARIRATKSISALATDVGAEWKRCFTEHYTKPPKSEKTFAYLLLTLWDPDRVKLYSALARNFYEVGTFEIFGTGADVARAAVAPFYTPDIKVEDATVLGIYGISQAKKYAQLCGGETEVVRCRQIEEGKVAIGKLDAALVRESEADVQTFMRAAGPALFSFVSARDSEKEAKSSLNAFTYALLRYRKEKLGAKEREKRAWDREILKSLREMEKDGES